MVLGTIGRNCGHIVTLYNSSRKNNIHIVQQHKKRDIDERRNNNARYRNITQDIYARNTGKIYL